MFNHLSIRTRLLAIFVCVVIATMALVGTLAWLNYRSLMQQRADEIRSVVEATVSVIDRYQQATKAGTMSEEEARKAAFADVNAMRYRGKEYLFVQTPDHVTLVHPISPGLIGKDLTNLQDKAGAYFVRDYIKVAMNEGEGVTFYYWPKPGSEEPLRKMTYVKHYKPWNVVVGSGLYVDDINAAMLDNLKWVAGLTLLCLALIGLATRMISSSIINPLNALSSAMTTLATGGTDVSVAGADRRDEIGPMAKSVLAFRDSIRERNALADETHADHERRHQRDETVRSLIDGFRDSAEGTIATVIGSAGHVRRDAQSLREMAGRTTHEAENAASTSESASGNVQTVAAAAGELSASIAEISGKVTETMRIVGTATTMTEDTNAKVSGLAVSAQKIGDVVSLISAIAEQTNLLALNATIEAARAGEAGKGFAVVAQEVKQLASQTAKATEDISSQVGAVQRSTDEAVKAIQAIAKVMSDVNHTTTAIAAAVEEQGMATQEISRNAQLAATGTRTMVENISGVTQVAEATSTSAGKVIATADSMSEAATRLRKDMAQFLARVAAA